MQSSLKRIITGAIFFVATTIVAVGGYMSAGWTLLESTYMVTITIFGVGYGEEREMSPPLKVFTMGVIIAGTSSAVYTVGGFIQLLTEGEINRALGARRMSQGIGSLEDHAIVCGFGRVGEILAARLAEVNHPFVVVDSNPQRVEQARELGYWVRCGSAGDEEVLLEVGVKRAKVLATVLPDDAANVFITLTARGLNPDLTIVARGVAPTTEPKLRLAGANQVVMPAAIGAIRMADTITNPAAVEFLDQADGTRFLNEQLAHLDARIDELSIPANSPLEGLTLPAIEAQGKHCFIVVAVRHSDGTVSRPEAVHSLQADDTVIVIARREAIPQLRALQKLQRGATYRGSRI